MRFVERCRSVPFWQRLTRLLPARRVDEYFLVRGGTGDGADEYRDEGVGQSGVLLRLFDLARARSLSIVPPLIEDIHRHVDEMSPDAYRTPEVSHAFLRILAGPGATGTLDAMHRAHLLEKLVPAMGKVRGLMQFNQYHKYTVDEHSLLAVGHAEALSQDKGVLGEVYRRIKRKDILHLAVLMHDLGKGQEQDHSDVGKRLSEDVAACLGFDEQETRTLAFLVHRHLLMAHTAFRRDPNDEKVVLPFAREVGTPEVLKKLLALTAADIAAVGPGVLTKWKESLLIELYERTMPEVSGDRGEQACRSAGRKWSKRSSSSQPGHGQNRSRSKPGSNRNSNSFRVRYFYGTDSAAHCGQSRRQCDGYMRRSHGRNRFQPRVGNLRIFDHDPQRADARNFFQNRGCDGCKRQCRSWTLIF